MSLSVRPQHLNRYREIASVLARHGRAGFVQSAGLDSAFDGPALDDASASVNGHAEELASDLERLGPTFVKLGQLLSTRADLLTEPYVTALTRLQDNCEPFPFAEVEQVVQTELGARMSRLFEDFDNVPLAAASLGQVHRAQLRSGQQVAVKVQRPGIREQMASDLEILGELAEFFDAHSKQAKRYAVGEAFEQFRRTLVAELDYQREAANLTALREVLHDRPAFVVPAPVDNLTTSRVLTMDFIDGRRITDLGPLARVDLDLAPLADELFGGYLEANPESRSLPRGSASRKHPADPRPTSRVVGPRHGRADPTGGPSADRETVSCARRSARRRGAGREESRHCNG